METQIHHNDSSGNWIAFLFGVMFNLMTTANDPRAINYLAHAIVGGFICLFFKMIGDMLSPLFRALGNRLKRWIDKYNIE